MTTLKPYSEAVRNLSLVLCNNLPEVDPTIWDNVRKDLYDEESDTYRDIFQFFICGTNEFEVKYLEEHFPSLIFSYSELLDTWVLMVDHYGTHWSGVMVDYVE